MPAPVRLTYHFERGVVRGQAEMLWRPQAQAYRLSLTARLPLLGEVLRQTSVGDLDRAGLAPHRHTDRRRSGSERAVNFQREPDGGGRVSFSGPSHTFALVPGAQDRLSWMLQAAAILNAQPALGQRPGSLRLWVASARGDADVWVVRVTPEVAGVHLSPVPQRPYETRIDLWLDPARQHVPVRLVLTEADGSRAELVLDSVEKLTP